MLGMMDYKEKILEDVKTGKRILVEIDSIPGYHTKQEVLEAVKNWKTVKRVSNDDNMLFSV